MSYPYCIWVLCSLFSLYTADCRSANENCLIDKYADDTALVGQIINDDSSNYLQEINSFVNWCDQNFLELNVSKTKEMVIDFRTTNKTESLPVVIKGAEVERVGSFKYLGVVFDDKLSWDCNTDALVKKVNTRMYCLRKLRSFHVSTHLLELFYSSVVCGVLTFGLTSWGGNLTKFDSGRVDRVIRRAGKIIGKPQDTFDTLYDRRVACKLTTINKDNTHPLWAEFDCLRIVRSGRFRIPKARTSRFLNSYVPSAVRSFNNKHHR